MSAIRASMSQVPRRIMFEAQGLDVLLLDRPPRHCIDSDLGQNEPVEQPGLGALGQFDDARLAVGELLGQSVAEQVRRLDQVVVDRDEEVMTGLATRLGVGARSERAVDRHSLNGELLAHSANCNLGHGRSLRRTDRSIGGTAGPDPRCRD